MILGNELTFYVWHEDFTEEPQQVKATTARKAAEQWVENCESSFCEYDVAAGREEWTVIVFTEDAYHRAILGSSAEAGQDQESDDESVQRPRICGGKRFKVSGETVPIYYAKEVKP